MASPEENLHYWDTVYDWSQQGGEEWSSRWGGSCSQWCFTVRPRLARMLPCGRLLEIGPGFGRWTHYLREHCTSLLGVDLAPRCVHACKARFAEDARLRFVVTDGRGLIAEDASVDLVFSFESLVHAEADQMEVYLAEVARVLAPGGRAFLHHSNLGEYRDYFAVTGMLPRATRRALNRLGVLDLDQWRAPTMSAAVFRRLARRTGLVCTGQELVNWGARRLIDCFSTVASQGSPGPTVRNPAFMEEVAEAGRLASLYVSGCVGSESR